MILISGNSKLCNSIAYNSMAPQSEVELWDTHIRITPKYKDTKVKNLYATLENPYKVRPIVTIF